MKQPKFVGIKKGYDALFIGEHANNDYTDRIRVMKDDGSWKWDWADNKRKFDKRDTPCWWSGTKNARKAFRQMRQYDRSNDRKTYFLGYIKKEV